MKKKHIISNPTNPGAVPSQSYITKSVRELLNPEPSNLELKIEALKTNKTYQKGRCNFGKFNINFDNTKSI